MLSFYTIHVTWSDSNVLRSEQKRTNALTWNHQSKSADTTYVYCITHIFRNEKNIALAEYMLFEGNVMSYYEDWYDGSISTWDCPQSIFLIGLMHFLYSKTAHRMFKFANKGRNNVKNI